MNEHTLSQARFLRLLLTAIGAATPLLAGCGGNVVVDPDGQGGNSTTTGSTTGSTTTTFTMTADCNQYFASSDTPDISQTCAANSSAFSVNVNCFEPPFGPGSCGAFTDACVLSTYNCGFISGGDKLHCGPFDDGNGLCCYTISGDCAVGRPFTVDGRARLAPLVARGGDWAASIAPDTGSLSAETRAALADAWGREALFEHASIASFARFTMQLLALGAPADLVRDTQRALADEIDHARLAAGLASAYAGAPLGFGALPIDGALAGSGDAAAIAASLASEGCVAETIAALQAAAARDEARDPAVKSALSRVADEEAAHAELAWRALAWALDSGGPEVRRAVERVFAEAEIHVSIGAVTDLPGDAIALRAHGYLPLEERRALAREALGRVVGPAATALLHGKRTSPSTHAHASA